MAIKIECQDVSVIYLRRNFLKTFSSHYGSHCWPFVEPKTVCYFDPVLYKWKASAIVHCLTDRKAGTNFRVGLHLPNNVFLAVFAVAKNSSDVLNPQNILSLENGSDLNWKTYTLQINRETSLAVKILSKNCPSLRLDTQRLNFVKIKTT